jgi:hypothetical protein
MASSTKPDYDAIEAAGGITPAKVDDSSKVNLEGRSSRGSVVGSPEEVVAVGADEAKLNTKDAATAYLDLLHRGSASQRQLEDARARLGDSVGWENPDITEAPDHTADNLPPSRVDRLEAEKAAKK